MEAKLNIKFDEDFKEKVKLAVKLLDDANQAIRRGEDATMPVCIYNSTVATIQHKWGGEWWIFRARAFKDGANNDGIMDSRGGVFNPFKKDVPRIKAAA